MTIKPISSNKVSAGRKKKDKNELSLQIDLMSTLHKSIEEYLDRYEGIK